jgi:hypothetical protein
MKPLFFLLLSMIAVGLWAEGQGEKPVFEQVILEGDYFRPAQQYQAYLRSNPGDTQARGEMGIVQALDALEFFSQGMLRVSNSSARLWLPSDWEIQEESWDYPQFTAFLQTFSDKLSASQKTLAQVRQGNLRIPFVLPTAAFDFTGDGLIQKNERLLGLLGEFDLEDISPEEIQRLTFYLDLSDVVWLEGYVSLLKAWVELALWYDLSDLYYQFFPTFFQVKYPQGWRAVDLSNYTIALRDPGKGKVAQQDFLRMFQLGQDLWDYVLAETDDDKEWISGPGQTSPFEDFGSDPALIEAWKKTLSLWSKVLRGIYLVEIEEGLGLNLHLLLTEPKPIPTDFARFEAFLMSYAGTGAILDGDELLAEMDAFGSVGWLFGLWAN